MLTTTVLMWAHIYYFLTHYVEHTLSDVTAQNIWSFLYANMAYLFVDNTARYVFIINRCSFDEETITNVIKTAKQVFYDLTSSFQVAITSHQVH